ncbi:MAG: hypothetical protein MZW92_66745 [Comamonadaceae bacterium]|nr:hypothetical protein [Comamonadaceae bacterium]
MDPAPRRDAAARPAARRRRAARGWPRSTCRWTACSCRTQPCRPGSVSSTWRRRSRPGPGAGRDAPAASRAWASCWAARRYTAHRDAFPAGITLRVEARCELVGDNGLGQFACRIATRDGEELASAMVSVFEPPPAPPTLDSTETPAHAAGRGAIR